jgi:DNA-binding transcriptional MerR regulator
LKTYSTAQIAALIGVHPNTVRFYERIGLLPTVPRAKNGYRVFDDRHLAQLRLLRAAFRAEIISDRLRREAYEIVKTAAAGDAGEAYRRAEQYREHLREERAKAEEAILIAQNILGDIGTTDETPVFSGRHDTAGALGVTVDILRDWERNGLIRVPRATGGRRQYRHREMNRLKIIGILRNAHYSMMSILRMLNRLDEGDMNIREAIDTPGEEEDIVHATDRYISALTMAERDASEMMDMLRQGPGRAHMRARAWEPDAPEKHCK